MQETTTKSTCPVLAGEWHNLKNWNSPKKRSAERQISTIIIQLLWLLYRKRAKQVQISHDIVQLVIVQLAIVQHCARARPFTLVVFFQVTEKGWKKFSWIINLLLDVLMWSITVYFYSLLVFWLTLQACQNTAQLVKIYFTSKHLIRYISSMRTKVNNHFGINQISE